MKKLLSILSSFSLVTSTSVLTANVIACEGKYSKEIYNIITYDAANYFGVPLYSYNSFKPDANRSPVDIGIDGCTFGTIDEDTPTCALNLDIMPNNVEQNFKYETWVQILIKYFEEASVWFENILKNHEYEWKILIIKDLQLISETEKNLPYELELEMLNILLDEIVTTDFQLNIAKLAVLKRNIKLVEVYKNYLDYMASKQEESNKERAINIAKLDLMIDWVNDGMFNPLFKFVYLGQAVSRGPSQTKIKFDERLIGYIDTGRHGVDSLAERYFQITNEQWIELLDQFSFPVGENEYHKKLEHYAISYNMRETLDLYAYDQKLIEKIREEIGGE
ncbi:lipoprotein [Spiroplasma culicicola]|uniref:Lipoprotein n=1 Tax=Spiroplasma culicicola AES-1 TaxID=1276246 RepID=W6A646_9MOLU|nr:lipoprotein [Spiroplasma culicicola]AHI52593.1 hypothetical protein SCULI_v1c02520 [Spiroplasma culicicola AES-1]